MTKEEFKNLAVGDVVIPKDLGKLGYAFPMVIISSDEEGMHKVAIQNVNLRIPENYNLIIKMKKV